MKGNEKLMGTLNSLLSDELTAINQYMVHSEMSANWGYEKLHKHATREILEDILQNEDAHVDRIEELQDQIGHMTLPLFLTTQVG